MREQHVAAIDALLTTLEDAAGRLEAEARSGTRLGPEQLRRLRIARRALIFVEEENGS